MEYSHHKASTNSYLHSITRLEHLSSSREGTVSSSQRILLEKSPSPPHHEKKRKVATSTFFQRNDKKKNKEDPLAAQFSATATSKKTKRAQTKEQTNATTNLFHKVQLSENQKKNGTRLSVEVFEHLRITKLKEKDLGRCNRRHVPIGYTGLACFYCDNERGGRGGRYFPSSLKTLCDSNKSLLSMYSHLSNCKYCPSSVKKHLKSLYEVYDEDRKTQKRGSKKKYYEAIWEFLREGEKKK